MKRIFLFLVTNIAVLVVISVIVGVLGLDRFITAQGLDLTSLLIFSAVVGFAGSIISLLISKPMAKMSTGARVIDGSEGTTEFWLVETVRKLASQAGIGMPEVAIFEGAPNAFATGAFKNSALVAVSTGLLQTMERQEVEAVLGHEVAHVANGDMVTLTLIQGVVNTFVIFLSRIIGFLVDKAIFRTERVSRVRLEGRVATGVEFTHRGEAFFAEAKRETLLAAGAIGSPQLLQLSGIGPPELLQHHGIPVIHDLPGVGENLHDHLQIRLQYKVKNVKTLNGIANSAFGKALMALEYFAFRTGPLTMPPSQAGAFARSDPSQPTPNIEWHVQPLSLDKFGDPLHSFPAITPSVCNLRPTSRGWVRIRASDPAAHPEIRLNYLSTDEDRRVAVDGMRYTRRIMAAKALAKYEPAEYRPGASVTSEAALARAAGELGTTIFHPVGTCKMGRDAMAVVDDELRVHGIGRLRVIDASIFPRITSGNTNAPTYVIAEKGARAILKPNAATPI